MTKDAALKLALEALDIVKLQYTQNRHVNEAIAAIKEALAQPEERPWVGLTDSEADNIISYPWGETKNWIKAIEATLKEKNA
tara:strand:- start:249 stop:494 length:246 start_codon:yes stop_codon:yes gene_type:complete